MRISHNKAKWSPLIYLALAALFGFLAVKFSNLKPMTFYMAYIQTRIGLTWVFWLSLGLAMIFLLRVINSVLRELHSRNLLPNALAVFYRDESRVKLHRFLSALKISLHGLGGELAVVSLAILLVVGFISTTSLVRVREAGTYLNEWTSALIGMSSESRTLVSVLQIPMMMEGSGTRQYLKTCLKVVTDVGKLGAKAVLVDIRGMESWRSREDWGLIQELDKSGIVVFGAHDFYGFPRDKLSRAIVTLPEDEVRHDPLMNRISPIPGRNPKTALDVTLELVRKFRNYSPDLAAERHGSLVTFGDYKIPVTSDGWTYSRDRWGEIAFWSRIYAFVGDVPDSITYKFMRNRVSYSGSLTPLRDEISNKIILLGRMQGSLLDDFTFNKVYAAAVQNTLDSTLTRKIEWSPLWITALCLAIASLIAYRFSSLVAALLILILGALLILADSYLYVRMNVLLEIIYPLLSLLMAMVILPALAFVHRLGDSGS